jgi:hypothetical protein
MHDFVTAGGAKFLVGLQYHEAPLEAFLRARGIPYTSFDGAESYADGNHWTPAGHRLVSRRLQSLLSETGTLASPDKASIIQPNNN